MRTIAHISDLHFGRVNSVVADALADELRRLKPDVLVASGDFTQRARPWQYEEAAAYLRSLPGNLIVVPGNHDIPMGDLVRRFFAPLERYQKYISPDLRPFYHDDELALLGINTARSLSLTWNFWKDGHISAGQLLDVKQRLCGLPESVFKVVVTHHPFIPPPGERRHGIVHGAAQALDMMERCGVDMVLAGHLHMGYSGDVRTHHEAVKRSILSVQAGTAISTRKRSEPNAYNRITIEPGHVTIEVRAWEGKAFASSTVKRYERVAEGWREKSGE